MTPHLSVAAEPGLIFLFCFSVPTRSKHPGGIIAFRGFSVAGRSSGPVPSTCFSNHSVCRRCHWSLAKAGPATMYLCHNLPQVANHFRARPYRFESRGACGHQSSPPGPPRSPYFESGTIRPVPQHSPSHDVCAEVILDANPDRPIAMQAIFQNGFFSVCTLAMFTYETLSF